MLKEKKDIFPRVTNLGRNRGRNLTPLKYLNTLTNDTGLSKSYKSKDLTPNHKLRSRIKIYNTEKGISERQEDMLNSAIQEKDSHRILFQDLLY